MPFKPTPIGNNEYDYAIKLLSSEMPSGYIEINSYTLVLKFYRYDEDLEAFISSDVIGTAGEKVTMGQDEDGSLRFERTWVVNSADTVNITYSLESAAKAPAPKER